jgi:hypothetical protein
MVIVIARLAFFVERASVFAGVPQIQLEVDARALLVVAVIHAAISSSWRIMSFALASNFVSVPYFARNAFD